MSGLGRIAGMMSGLAGAAVLALTAPAMAQSDVKGEITVWSWNVAATALKAVVPDFNKAYPNVKVTVEDLGNQPPHSRCQRPGTSPQAALGVAHGRSPEGANGEAVWVLCDARPN